MLYKDGDVQIVPVDVFNPVTGPLLPMVALRIRQFAEANFAGVLPPPRAARVGAIVAHRLVSQQALGAPNILIGAFITPDGRLIGHLVAVVQEEYGERWVFVTQCKLDEPAGDAVSRGIELVKRWGRSNGADSLFFETKRSDSAWVRAYGFKTMHHTMWMSLNGTMQDATVEERVEST